MTTAQDLANQVSGSLTSASKLANRLGKWLAIAALVAAFAVASLLTVSAVSRRVREFGTLKAIGWRSRRIVCQVLGESIVQGIAGGVIGVAIGFVGARLIGWFSPELKATVGTTRCRAGRRRLPAWRGRSVPLRRPSPSRLGAPVSVNLVLLAVGLAVAGGLLAGAFGGLAGARVCDPPMPCADEGETDRRTDVRTN